MKRALIFILILIAGLFLYYKRNPLISKVRIGGDVVYVDVAVTEPQKQLGLGGREVLEADHGMLFVYDHKEQYEFWMRGMLIPLDFIWIDGSRVADIMENVPQPNVGEQPRIVKPRAPVDKVLEVNAGTVKRLGITIGDTVEFLDR